MTEKKEANNEIERATQADLNFQARLAGHSKQALILLVDQLTTVNRNQRGWVLKYLRGVEELMPAPKAASLQDRILEAVKSERLAQDCQMGPVNMRPMRLYMWMHNLKNLIEIGYDHAIYGQDRQALKYLLKIASEAVAALEDRVDKEAKAGLDVLAEAMKVVTVSAKSDKQEGPSPYAPFKRGNKKADTRDGARIPAESELSKNQQSKS